MIHHFMKENMCPFLGWDSTSTTEYVIQGSIIQIPTMVQFLNYHTIAIETEVTQYSLNPCISL